MAGKEATSTMRTRAAKPAASLVRAALARILESETFHRSARLQRFLRFTVEGVLAGRGGELKEYLIGLEVYDRKAAFDSRLDPIVRVEARRLRAKLAKYYSAEGRDAPVVIEYPRGEYAPVFRRRHPVAAISPTIAVLPFADLSPTRNQEYFCDGLAEEITTTLTKLGRLRVVPSTLSRLRSAQLEVTDLAHRLGVATVVRGSVRRAGARLRITVQLIQATDGACLWSETYERRMKDIFLIQDEIARAIAERLDVRPAGSVRPLAARTQGTRDAEGFHLYLKGRYLLRRQGEDAMRHAIKFLERAVAKDAELEVAHSALAQALMSLAFYGGDSAMAVSARAEEAVNRALELDPESARAQTALATIRATCQWRWADAEREFQRAIALDPSNPAAHYLYAVACLVPLARLEKATTELERSLALDPASPVANFSLSIVLYMRGEPELARQQARSAIELDPASGPGYLFLAMSSLETGDIAEAIRALEEIRGRGGEIPFVLGGLGQCYGLAGQPDRAREFLDRLEKLARRRWVAPIEMARIHIGLGDRDGAFRELNRALEVRCGRLIWLRVHPMYASLRPDRRFRQLLARMRLPGHRLRSSPDEASIADRRS